MKKPILKIGLLLFCLCITTLLSSCRRDDISNSTVQTVEPVEDTTEEEQEEQLSLYTDEDETYVEENGRFFACIRSTDSKNRTVTFDKAQLLFVGQDDDKIRELGEDPDESPSGYYIIDNEEDKGYTLTLAKGADINGVDLTSEEPATTFKKLEEEEFLEMTHDEWRMYCYITVKDNEITAIYEQFLP